MENTLATPLSLTEPAPRRTLRATLRTWLNLWSERRHLGQLDDRMLADIGMTREQVLAEANRAPWDVPASRDPTQ